MDEKMNDVVDGFMKNLSFGTRQHLKKCKHCSDKIGPILKNCYEIYMKEIMDPKSKFMINLNEMTLIIGTHMGLDPSKFPGAVKP